MTDNKTQPYFDIPLTRELCTANQSTAVWITDQNELPSGGFPLRLLSATYADQFGLGDRPFARPLTRSSCMVPSLQATFMSETPLTWCSGTSNHRKYSRKNAYFVPNKIRDDWLSTVQSDEDNTADKDEEEEDEVEEKILVNEIADPSGDVVSQPSDIDSIDSAGSPPEMTGDNGVPPLLCSPAAMPFNCLPPDSSMPGMREDLNTAIALGNFEPRIPSLGRPDSINPMAVYPLSAEVGTDSEFESEIEEPISEDEEVEEDVRIETFFCDTADPSALVSDNDEPMDDWDDSVVLADVNDGANTDQDEQVLSEVEKIPAGNLEQHLVQDFESDSKIQDPSLAPSPGVRVDGQGQAQPEPIHEMEDSSDSDADSVVGIVTRTPKLARHQRITLTNDLIESSPSIKIFIQQTPSFHQLTDGKRARSSTIITDHDCDLGIVDTTSGYLQPSAFKRARSDLDQGSPKTARTLEVANMDMDMDMHITSDQGQSPVTIEETGEDEEEEVRVTDFESTQFVADTPMVPIVRSPFRSQLRSKMRSSPSPAVCTELPQYLPLHLTPALARTPKLLASVKRKSKEQKQEFIRKIPNHGDDHPDSGHDTNNPTTPTKPALEHSNNRPDAGLNTDPKQRSSPSEPDNSVVESSPSARNDTILVPGTIPVNVYDTTISQTPHLSVRISDTLMSFDGDGMDNPNQRYLPPSSSVFPSSAFPSSAFLSSELTSTFDPAYGPSSISQLYSSFKVAYPDYPKPLKPFRALCRRLGSSVGSSVSPDDTILDSYILTHVIYDRECQRRMHQGKPVETYAEYLTRNPLKIQSGRDGVRVLTLEIMARLRLCHESTIT